MNARDPKPSRERNPMTDEQLKAFIRLQESRASRPEISAEQAQAIDYYYRRPYGNEEEGRSQAISSDVWDVVEGMTPSVVEPFVSSSDLVQFNAQGKEDEEAAQQESDFVNFTITQRNDAFTQFVAWVKAGLLLKNGIVKYWWDYTRAVTIETYRGLTLSEVVLFSQDPDCEIIAASHAEPEQPIADPGMEGEQAEEAQEAQQMAPQQPPQPGQPPMQPPMQPTPVAGAVMQQGAPEPAEPTFDIKVRRGNKEGYARYEVIPPEEFLIIGKSPNPQKASFVQHRTLTTISDLREMGYDVADDIADDGASDPNSDEVYAARHRATEPTMREAYDGSGNPAMREVWFKESYCYVDADGDGIAELRKVCMVGNDMLAHDETEEIPFAAWTPSQQLFQFDGRCPADEAIEVQDNKTTLMRQNSDNLYTINNNRVFAGPNVVLDDLLDNQIAGVVRTTGATPLRDQVMALPVTPIGAVVMPMIEYWDSVKENRTGFTRYNQGTDDAAGNEKTLGEVQIVAGAGSKRTGLTIRSLAEQGMKPLMLGVHGLLRRHATKAETVRLRGKWVTIDPRTWRLREDMTVSVGTGTMDKQQELTTQQTILKMQAGLAPAGIVTPENQYNAAAKFVELAGEKDTDKYFTHPDKIPPAPQHDPMQDPEVMLKVAGHKLDEAKFMKESAQKDRELDQVDRELDQVDQKQGIEAQNAQADALQRFHELQLKTEAHMKDMAAPHPQELAAGNQALQAQQQAHGQQMDAVGADHQQQQIDIQANPPPPPEAAAPAEPKAGQ
jgi:hypothetical protein